MHPDIAFKITSFRIDIFQSLQCQSICSISTIIVCEELYNRAVQNIYMYKVSTNSEYTCYCSTLIIDGNRVPSTGIS